ncbi:MAG: polysaccharide biosynthesis tyrosine autokinase [SAR202 cluster bacterium]|nr:polysaccharide biosynthesis tyrosine autokinase [SAR202 cluster bacterium]
MEDEGLDLEAYLRIIAHWWWVLLLGTLGAALAGFLIRSDPVPLYAASTKVLVEGKQTPGTPSSGDIRTSQELAAYYKDLILTRPTLEKISERLSSGYSPDKVGGALEISSRGSFIEIRAEDRDPAMAARIANVSAETFIEDLQDRQFAQIAQFQASLSQYGITQDPSIVAAQVASLRTLTIVEEAQISGQPFNPPNRVRDTALAAVVGFLLAGLVILALEYFDDSIRSADELKKIAISTPTGSVLGVVALGSVAMQRLERGKHPSVLDDEVQRGPMAESYKYIVLNLEFSALESEKLKSIVVTSALPGEGKTTTATNLAISIARSGRKVIIVDTDLRKPTVHKVLNVVGTTGLTTLLLGSARLEDVQQHTAVEGLTVISSGPLPPDSTRVLRSHRMAELVKELESRTDFVIFDSPPVLAVADAIVLTSLADGALFVVDAVKTRREPLRRAVQSVQQVNPVIVGAVLNKVSTRDRRHYYYHHYYYYDQDRSDRANKGRLGWLKLPFTRINGHRQRRRRSRSSTAPTDQTRA